MIDLKDIKNINIPISGLIGFVLGVIIGMVVGIVRGGFLIEVFVRSVISGLLMGATLFGVEHILRRMVPELFEETKPTHNQYNSSEISDEDIDLGKLYTTQENSEFSEDLSQTMPDSFPGEENSVPESTAFDMNSFSGKDNFAFSEKDDQSLNESFDLGSFDKPSESIKDSSRFTPFEFTPSDNEGKVFTSLEFPKESPQVTSGSLGVTDIKRSGATEDFLILGKGKPIQKDYKKLADVIRQKLYEDK